MLSLLFVSVYSVDFKGYSKELKQEAIFDIIQKQSKRVKQLLVKKNGITDEDILQAAIQAAKESIEEEYGVNIGDN